MVGVVVLGVERDGLLEALDGERVLALVVEAHARAEPACGGVRHRANVCLQPGLRRAVLHLARHAGERREARGVREQ